VQRRRALRRGAQGAQDVHERAVVDDLVGQDLVAEQALAHAPHAQEEGEQGEPGGGDERAARHAPRG